MNEDEDSANDEDEDAEVSDDEDTNTQALAKIVDSDDEDEALVDADVAFQEGQDVGKIPDASKKLLKSSKSGDGERGVVYIGRIPRKSINLLSPETDTNAEDDRWFLRT